MQIISGTNRKVIAMEQAELLYRIGLIVLILAVFASAIAACVLVHAGRKLKRTLDAEYGAPPTDRARSRICHKS